MPVCYCRVSSLKMLYGVPQGFVLGSLTVLPLYIKPVTHHCKQFSQNIMKDKDYKIPKLTLLNLLLALNHLIPICLVK